MADYVISAKTLAALAKDRPCFRCFWTTTHIKSLPYQMFPAVFQSIDRYNKRIVHAYFQRQRCLPPWLAQLGNVEACIDPPHYTKFSIEDPATGIILRGEADGMFRMAGGSLSIVDYKTARYSAGQDALLPQYRIQLNGYAYIADRTGWGPVSQLALVYMEPLTDEQTAAAEQSVDSQGFILGLKALVVPVTLDPDNTIPGLLQTAKEIMALDHPPPSIPGCRDCAAVQKLVEAHR
jgi:hypothetical protein